MGSKFIVPLELFDFNTTPTDISSSGYKSFYLKTGWLKKLTGTTETDLVLQRPLSTFSVLGPGATGPINTSSTVEEAFEKLQQSLYINLVGDVTGTAAYNAGNLEIVTTVVGGGSSVPLTATKFNTNHNTALGNPYLIDDIVYYSGHIYKALANNDAITPAIGGNAYWSDLGAGFPYRQNPVDWNATSGDYQILNKPTNVSSFTNDAGYLTSINSTQITTALGYTPQVQLSGTGFVKASGTTISYDNTNYYPASNPNGYTSNLGTVTSISANTGMSFSTITTSGSIGIDMTKVPYMSGGFSTGLLKWNGSAWVFDNTSYYPTSNPSNYTSNLGTVTSIATTGLISGGTITSSGTITTSMNTNKLVGRSTAGTGIMEEISLGSGLSLSGGTLSNTATFTSPLTTKGDIFVRNASADTRLPIGLDTQILIADSTTSTGLKWGSNTTPPASGYYGSFFDATTQTASSINTPYAIKLSNTALSNGISIVSNSRITIANTGIYNIQFSAQFYRTNSGTDIVDLWLRKNGVDTPSTNTQFVMTGGVTASQVVAAWNFVVDAIGGDYYELMWATPDTHIEILYAPAQTSPFVHPAIPSVILTVTQQAGIMAGTGITAINSLSGAVQTLATGTTGSAFNIVSSGTTHTFNLPTATSAVTGALSSTDWTTFNGKQNTLSGSGIVKSTAGTISYIGGTSGQYIAGDGSLVTFPTIPTVGTWGALNYPTWTTGTPFVKMTAAGTFSLDTNVYLTSINSSQVTTALGYTPVPNTRNLTINGVTQDLSADRTFNVTSPGFALANYYNFY